MGSLLEVGTGFHPELTGRENIYLNGAILGMRRVEIDRKFDEIVAFAEIEKFLDTPVKRYSSGMYVRLAFAVAAHLEPEILLVDEVLAVGDAQFQKKCLGKMGDVAEEGRTVLFVSHNIAAIQALCRRAILLRCGSVAIDATAEVTTSEYLVSMENSAMLDLENRIERGGANKIQLTKIEMSSGEQSSSNILQTGESARFTFHLSDYLSGLQCEFTIYDDTGYAIAKFSSTITTPETGVALSENTRIVCVIDELLILPGRYRMNVAISAEGTLQDHVEGAIIFNIEAGRIRGQAIKSLQGRAKVFIPHHWYLPK